MSSRINSITPISSLAQTVPGSLNLYAVFDDVNYRLTLEQYRLGLGVNVGALVVRSTNLSWPSGAVASWDAAVYDPDGWWSPNSSSILQVKNANITHVTLRAGIHIGNPSNFSTFRFFRNGGQDTHASQINLQYSTNRIETYQSDVIEVGSGDRLELVGNFGSTTQQTADSNRWHWFSVTPERFA